MKTKPQVPVPDVTDVDVAFPARVDWLPAKSAIPAEFVGGTTKGHRFFCRLFYGSPQIKRGSIGMLPRDGVDPKKAWRALQVVLGTFAIQHEHKEAAFAYLIDDWFTDVRWTTVDGDHAPFGDLALDEEWRRKNGLT